MAKKPLTGQSKLSEAIQRKSAEENEGLPLVRQRYKPKLKNFRLAPADIMRLQKITDAINGESERPISETAVIKGLIALGEKTAPDKLLRLIREVW
ncbi:MAG: hypothetical protein KDJ65_26460 [Anaerolineae bacterium]|nr:hypothetical protein [Anaerolineae bacterium]MCP5127506.1 hypothetical protein [Gammaproteobacteria bacterium]